MSGNDPAPRRRGRRRPSDGGQPAELPSAAASAGAAADRPQGRRRAAPPPEPEAELHQPEDDLGDERAFYGFSAFLGIAAACVFAAALLTYSIAGKLDRNAVALLIVSLVLAVLYAIPRWEEIAASLSSRSARQGGSVTVTGVAVIGLLIVGNWYVNRHSPQWDLTAAKRYTLSDQSKKVLNNLTQDVKITFFVSGQDDAQYTRGAQDLLRQYQRASSRVSLQIVDANTNPAAAQNYQIRNLPDAIFEAGGRKEETTGVTEQDFTSALVKLSRTQQKKVYFLQGHQERDPESSDARGYSNVAQGLKRDNYDVQKLQLVGTGKVPDDAAVVVIAGPTTLLLDVEQKAVADYLNGGGRVLLLLNPQQDAGLTSLTDQWHVKLDNDFVLDPQLNYTGPQNDVPIPQAGNPISTSLTTVILPGARSVSVVPGAGGDFAIVPLLKTTASAWGETNFDAPPSFDPGQDIQGPLTMAVAINKTDATAGAPANGLSVPTPTPAAGQAPKGRLVAIGSVDFAANTLFAQVPGNRDLFINSVNWLAADEDLISIRALPAGAPPVTLTSQSRVLVLWTTVIFLPLAVLLIGGTIWWQRR